MSVITRRGATSTRAVAIGTVAGLVTPGLTACGASQAPRAEEGSTRGIEHAMGTTEISGTPKRVVTLDAAFTSAVMTLGGQVVGYTTSGAKGRRLPEHLGADRAKYGARAQWVGTLSDPNVERIPRLKPDLILSAKVRHERLHEQLSRTAPTAFSETTGGLGRTTCG